MKVMVDKISKVVAEASSGADAVSSAAPQLSASNSNSYRRDLLTARS